MQGAHRIILETKKVKYDFVIKRNITLLTGDSATGKTVLIDYIREYRRYGLDSGVRVSCDCPCRTLDNEDWETQLANISGSVIFIDEGNRFLVTKRFAEMLLQSDNYFVIATREKLSMLPYSVEEIYAFRQSGKYTNAKQKYNEIYHLYGELPDVQGVRPAVVITEDSNSGNEFFAELSNQLGVPCISANGKSNVIRTVEEQTQNYKVVLIVVDGAAYGSEMRDTYEYLQTNPKGVLYAPESFEWLLLSTNSIPGVDVRDILETPENFIDSRLYVSWERFFTELLTQKTGSDKVWRYSKKKLNKAYLSARVLEAVKRGMRLILWK